MYRHVKHNIDKNFVYLKRGLPKMAEVLFSSDGRPIDDTNALPVKIAGADATNGSVGVTTTDILPYERQATLVNTAVTHASAVCAPGNSVQATWQPVPDGMSEFINNLVADAGLTTLQMNVSWSDDGTNISGRTVTTLQATNSNQKTSINWLSVGGAFYKVEVSNGDASPHTCSANIRFRP